ncbi:MAG: FAD-dependent oxidoreductase [Nanoarchaeota archaeon]|nr:FAD-dependent oxidoreductase [Nanoarchaeota archaeon]
MVKGIYDLMILGTGAAGMAAAIYAGRYGLKTVIIGKMLGGATNYRGPIENYPGHIGTGQALMETFEKQAKEFGAVFVAGNVDKLAKAKSGFIASVGDKKYEGKALITALGSEHRKLGIQGEAEFAGKGVSYCATCDGNFFKGKIVSVIGGSDAAAKAAIYLSDICKKVYISYRKEKMRAEPINLQKVVERKNIEIIYNTKPVEIIGDTKVTGLKLESSVGKKLANDTLAVDGVFVEIGSTPIIEIFKGFDLKMEGGYIIVDKVGRTSVKGLYAAGDAANNPFKQTITATADGVLAAKAAYDFLKLDK